jgi:hypothetical protein
VTLPSSALTYELARPSDEPELRRLMRDNPMEGSISVAFTREPDFFAACAVEGERHQVMVARTPEGRPVAVFGRSVRERWLGGERRRVAYLSALRVDPAWRRKPAMFRRGFALVRAVHEAEGDATPWLFTSIIEDNAPARRLLEAGLSDLPRYAPIGVFCTLALPTWRARKVPRGVAVRGVQDHDVDAIVACLDRNLSRTDLAPAWTAADLRDPVRCRGLAGTDFVVAERDGQVVATCALWDQGAFKQSIVAAYAGGLKHTRGLVNLAAPLLGVPRLPPPGGQLAHAYLSHLAVDGDDPDLALAVLSAAHGRALGRGYAYVMTGLAEAHPLRAVVAKHFGAFAYRSVLYTVTFAGEPEAVHNPHVEVAVL